MDWLRRNTAARPMIDKTQSEHNDQLYPLKADVQADIS
jgi:hypothetical protein